MAWDTVSKPSRLFRRSRWQLTTWYTGVMAVVLGISSIGVYEAIAHAHRVTADRELKSVAETIHNALEKTLTANGQIDINDVPPNLLPNLCLAGERCLVPFEQAHHGDWEIHRSSYYIQVLRPDGELTATAGPYPEGLPSTDLSLHWQTLEDRQGNQYRQIVLPINGIEDQDLLAMLVVGRSFSDFAAYLTAVRWIIVFSLPITMGLIAVASWWLAGLAMGPVQVSYRKIQQFTADAAHELRTPLSAVQATTESVMRLPEISDSEARETLQVITRQNRRLTSLVSDLLLLSRLDTQSPISTVQCCLQDILSDIQEELAALAVAKNIHLQLDQPLKPSILVEGDEQQLYRLVFNVVSNALQYTPENGKVLLLLRQADGKALITVKDTGIGIAPEDQPHIFDRFYRIDEGRSRQSGGSGLGLSIAQAIAHAHGGIIALKSRLGQGSEFTMQLPLSQRTRP